MVKNKFGGKNAKKKASKSVDTVARQLILKETDQEYGKISTILGNCRFTVDGIDGKTYLGIVRGSMRKKVWVRMNSYILYSIRDFQEGKVDIIHVYNDDEVRQLQKLNEIPEKITKEEDINKSVEDTTDIIFDDI